MPQKSHKTTETSGFVASEIQFTSELSFVFKSYIPLSFPITSQSIPYHLPIYLLTYRPIHPAIHPSTSISMSLCLYVSMSLCLYLSIYLSIYVSFFLPTYLPTYLFFSPSPSLSLSLSLSLALCLSVYLCICVSIPISCCFNPPRDQTTTAASSVRWVNREVAKCSSRATWSPGKYVSHESHSHWFREFLAIGDF